MLVAIDFWNYLCNELDYRFFAGVPCLGFKSLYDTMSPKFLHYIPAVREDIALGIVCGALIAGKKSGIFIEDKNFYVILNILINFCTAYRINPIIFVNLGVKFEDSVEDFTSILDNHSIPYLIMDALNYKKDLCMITKESVLRELPGVVFIKEGTINAEI